MKIVYAVLLSLSLTACSGLKDRINLGDGKVLGSEGLYVVSVEAAHYAAMKKPYWTFSMLSKLNKARDVIAAIEGKRALEESVKLIMAEVNAGCITETCQAYVSSYFLQILDSAEEVDLMATGVLETPVAVLDQLIVEIEKVKAATS